MKRICNNNGRLIQVHNSSSARLVHAIIPARFASTRFPGKPLAAIYGKPMFWHVWSRASRCSRVASVTLATDDNRIADAAAALGVPFVMTRSDHASGTDRVYEAASKLGISPNALVINIQGDEPALDPSCLDALIQAFDDPSVKAATLARTLSPSEAASSDVVKVVCTLQGDSLYFSRAPIPFERDTGTAGGPILGHMGLYAFTMETLGHFVELPPSPLELTEKLEQLRLLQNGIPLRVVVTSHTSPGVDRHEDINAVLPLLQAE